jgi:hypothetical protein
MTFEIYRNDKVFADGTYAVVVQGACRYLAPAFGSERRKSIQSVFVELTGTANSPASIKRPKRLNEENRAQKGSSKKAPSTAAA